MRDGGVHLIGSVPLADAEAVFRTVAAALGPYLSRLPDGETGERRRWIFFQRLMLEKHPAMEVDPTVPLFALRQWDGKLLREMPLLRFRPGVDPDGVKFETGYAPAALASYESFRALQADGVIPAGVRFQVCLPTPMASAYMYVSPKSREAYIRAYERALREALDVVVSAVPAGLLAIQWDVCQEVLIYEGFFPDRPADYKHQIVAELARLGDAVPDAVEVGYHLCYGSPADEHLVMPRDMAIMVEMADDLRQALRRRVDFLHMPVPRDRDDADYFRPLTRLEGFDDSALYLGLIHHDDREGDLRRIAAARPFASPFGVAAECGWGRTDPHRVPGLLESHRAAAELLGVAPARDPAGRGPAGVISGPRNKLSTPDARGDTDMAQEKIPLDATRFATGMAWKDYLAQMGDTKARTEENYNKASLTSEEKQFFSGLNQVKHVMMLAENWCGDVHRNSPMIARIVEAMPGTEMKVFFRDQNPDLTDCYLNNGYRSIPVVAFFDKDWNEIGRWIERPSAATQKSYGIRTTTLDVAGEDQAKKDAAMNEFRKQVQAGYDTAPDKSLWRETVKEVRSVLETRLGLAAKK